jgi:hypothetical protein
MARTPFVFAVLWILAGVSAEAKDVFRNLPGPVAAYAKQFDQECQARGLGQAVINEHYRVGNPGPADVNGDGAPDFVIYKCMFGCSEKPLAFMGTGTPCPWGNLLISNGGQYTPVFLPGRVSEIRAGPPVRILLQRPGELRVPDNYCRDPFPNYSPVHVYELKKERFQLVGSCPLDGTCELASTAGL